MFIADDDTEHFVRESDSQLAGVLCIFYFLLFIYKIKISINFLLNFALFSLDLTIVGN